jgi:hypothetical protein
MEVKKMVKRKVFTQHVWSHVPSKQIKQILKKGRFPTGNKLTTKEKHNARQVLKKR